MAEMNNTNSTGQAMMRMVIGIGVLIVLTALLFLVAFRPGAICLSIVKHAGAPVRSSTSATIPISPSK